MARISPIVELVLPLLGWHRPSMLTDESSLAGVKFWSQPYRCFFIGLASTVGKYSWLVSVGTWLSLVEHSLGVRGVGSSNLPVPTNLLKSWMARVLPSVSGFRQRAPASLTPPKRLNFGCEGRQFNAASPEQQN